MDRLTALHVFATIVERGSMSAAADQLNMSRAKVTRYLAELETWMDTRLLHRTTRSLSLTSAGEETLNIAQQLLSVADQLEQVKHQETQHLAGQLRITASYSIVENILLDAINVFVNEWPDVSIDIVSTDKSVKLIDNRIDLAIRVTNDLMPNAVAKKLGECRSMLVASPEYLDQFGTPIKAQDLVRHKCLAFAYFGGSNWIFDGPNGPESVSIKGNISANVSEVLLAATLKGQGISLQPSPIVSPLLKEGKLLQVLSSWQPKTLGVYGIYCTRKQMTPLLRAFLDHLTQYFSDSPDWQPLTACDDLKHLKNYG